jgi:hypothetical protein
MFFSRFPLIRYRFGDSEPATIFNNLSIYVDLFDQLRDQVTFYEKYNIQDGDRPDIVSQRIYGRADYHWTFFLVNTSLRESGWPLPERELRSLIKKRYPHTVVTTEGNIAANFLPGVNVVGRTSSTTGKVVERNLDLGQLVIATDKDGDGVNQTFLPTEQIAAGDTAIEQANNTITATGQVVQYNSILHYKNTAGKIVDIDPYDQNISGLVPVTILEDNVKFNTDLKQISIIRPDAINSVVNEFFKLLSR